MSSILLNVCMRLRSGKNLPKMVCTLLNNSPNNNAPNVEEQPVEFIVGNVGTSTTVGLSPPIISQILILTIFHEVMVSQPD